MKLKTRDLTRDALNWAAAVATGVILQDLKYYRGCLMCAVPGQATWIVWSPSTNAGQAFGIIEQVGIDIHQVKTHPYYLNEYREDRAKLPGAEIVSRPLSVGPGRYIRFPSKPSKYEGKWLARLSVSHHNFGWRKEDCLSDTALIAATRCCAASKLGDEVDVPEVLV